MSPEALRNRTGVALRAAKEAEAPILSRFRGRVRIETKTDGSPVTDADREAEDVLRRRISREFPEDAILGEEGGETPGTSGVRWILDPIDGTRSFVHGVPLFATLIGIESEGKPVAGVIHLPAVGETVHAARGEGAWWTLAGEGPRPARVSGCSKLADALFLLTSIEGFATRGWLAVVESLARAAKRTRTWGDGYGYALVATGRAEIMIDPGLAIWDAAPLLPVLTEAGGAFTDWSGRARVDGGNGAATNGRLHEAVLEILQGVAAP